MKKFLMILLLSAGALVAQNSTNWDVRYYGDDHKSSDSLRFAVGDSCTGEYSIPDVGLIISVDSNWTASNLGFMVYNYLEEVWEPLTVDGDLVEYTITVGEATRIPPSDMAGLKTVKFYKHTSGSAVSQATTASSLQVATIRVN